MCTSLVEEAVILQVQDLLENSKHDIFHGLACGYEGSHFQKKISRGLPQLGVRAKGWASFATLPLTSRWLLTVPVLDGRLQLLESSKFGKFRIVFFSNKFRESFRNRSIWLGVGLLLPALSPTDKNPQKTHAGSA